MTFFICSLKLHVHDRIPWISKKNSSTCISSWCLWEPQPLCEQGPVTRATPLNTMHLDQSLSVHYLFCWAIHLHLDHDIPFSCTVSCLRCIPELCSECKQGLWFGKLELLLSSHLMSTIFKSLLHSTSKFVSVWWGSPKCFKCKIFVSFNQICSWLRGNQIIYVDIENRDYSKPCQLGSESSSACINSK